MLRQQAVIVLEVFSHTCKRVLVKMYEVNQLYIFVMYDKWYQTFVHAGVLVLEHGELVYLAELLEHGAQVVLLEVARDLADEQFDGVLAGAGRRAGALGRRERRAAPALAAQAVHRRRRRRAYARLPALRHAHHAHARHVVPQQHRVHAPHIRSQNHVYHS